jgi:hypothetical protein
MSAGLDFGRAMAMFAAKGDIPQDLPVGAMIPMRGRYDSSNGRLLDAPVVPPKYLWCDGSALTPGAYPELEPKLTFAEAVVGGIVVPYEEMTASASSSAGWLTGGASSLLGAYWYSDANSNINWWQMSFLNGPRRVTVIESNTSVSALNIYGSTDGVSFTKISDKVTAQDPSRLRFAIQSPGDYSHYRIESPLPGQFFLSGFKAYEGAALVLRPRLPGGADASYELPGGGSLGTYWLIKAQP